MMKIVTILVVIFSVVCVVQSHRGRRYLRQELDVQQPRDPAVFRTGHEHLDCSLYPCENGGTCEVWYCVCNSRWSGDRCEIATCNQDKLACQNGGTCKERVSGHYCACNSRWTGDRCEIATCNQDKLACQNGGTCEERVSGHYCACNSRWTGDRCEIATYNSKCVFPFKYQGVEYKKCTNVDGDGKYWCAFNNPYVMYSERLVGWDWCQGEYGPEYNQGITCDVPSIDHATTNCEANAGFGSTCEVTCDAGYVISGSATITCSSVLYNGSGDYPNQPSCRGAGKIVTGNEGY